MFLTTARARILDCPQMSRGIVFVKCRANECPWWRWGGFTRITRGDRTWSVVKNINEVKREIGENDTMARVGFCGAVGYPEGDES